MEIKYQRDLNYNAYKKRAIMNQNNIQNGAHYYSSSESIIHRSSDQEMYTYTLYHGPSTISIDVGDCVYYIDDITAYLKRGPAQIESKKFAVVVRGFAPPDKSAAIKSRMVLPYVNGCSTRQIFPPERPGDPTLQLLNIPANSSEQAHHIHSTVRVVHVLSGHGYSIVGMNSNTTKTKLIPGMSIVLDNMVPHHFETDDQDLLVMPVHIWSTMSSSEYSHPMFSGTFLMNQGN